MKNREGFRICSCCKLEKELVSDNFCSDKNRKSGFSYRCKSCDAIKKDNRKERYKKLSEEEKEIYKAKNREYCSKGLGRANGTTLEVATFNYASKLAFKEGANSISTNVPNGNFTVELKEGEMQTIETALAYTQVALEQAGYEVVNLIKQ